MKNLLTRTITGLIFVVILAGAILWNGWSLALLFLLISIGCYIEFSKLFKYREEKPGLVTGIIAGTIIYVLFFLFSKGHLTNITPVILVLPLLTLLMGAEVLKKSGNSLVNIALTVFGIIYVFIPFALTNFIANDPFEPEVFHPLPLLGIFILIWVNDVFAYLGGVIAGRHKLYERLSPNKTWEGTMTGIIFTIVASYPVYLFEGSISLVHWAILALLISVFGIFGDLFESMIKRNSNLKDSGSLLPGHGGLLDRFDAFLFAIPVATAYILVIAQ